MVRERARSGRWGGEGEEEGEEGSERLPPLPSRPAHLSALVPPVLGSPWPSIPCGAWPWAALPPVASL